MMLDDGWDVPYGTLSSVSTEAFALMDPHPARFPSLGATRRERLTNLNRRLVEAGWRGAGLWVACQCHGESDCLSYVPSGRARAEWRAKVEDCAAAGIGYLKVDWGMRSCSAGFRRMLSELAREIAPGMVVEHKPTWCHPFNYIKVRKGADRVAGPGRMLDALRAEVNPEDDYDRQVFAFSDVVRIYDMLSPIDGTTALERVAAFSELIDRNGFGTMPRLVGGRKWTPVADVSLEEEVCAGMPLAVFGEVGSLTLRDGGPKARVFARDLAGGEAEDITAACARHDGHLTLPGDVLGRIGRSAAPGDSSSPGTLVEEKVRR